APKEPTELGELTPREPRELEVTPKEPRKLDAEPDESQSSDDDPNSFDADAGWHGPDCDDPAAASEPNAALLRKGAQAARDVPPERWGPVTPFARVRQAAALAAADRAAAPFMELPRRHDRRRSCTWHVRTRRREFRPVKRRTA